MRKREVVVAIIQRGDKILIGERPPKDKEAHLWEFPGGKLKDKEEEEEALRREVREELGLEIEIRGKIITSEKEKSKFHFYFCEARNSVIEKTFHRKLRWISIKDFKKYRFCKVDKSVLKEIEKYLKKGSEK